MRLLTSEFRVMTTLILNADGLPHLESVCRDANMLYVSIDSEGLPSPSAVEPVMIVRKEPSTRDQRWVQCALWQHGAAFLHEFANADAAPRYAPQSARAGRRRGLPATTTPAQSTATATHTAAAYITLVQAPPAHARRSAVLTNAVSHELHALPPNVSLQGCELHDDLWIPRYDFPLFHRRRTG